MALEFIYPKKYVLKTYCPILGDKVSRCPDEACIFEEKSH
jgi:hypothetical protein